MIGPAEIEALEQHPEDFMASDQVATDTDVDSRDDSQELKEKYIKSVPMPTYTVDILK